MPPVTPMSQSFAASAPDSRADGGIRTISLSQRWVCIKRLVAGIKMHLAVPTDAYEGVVLICDDQSDQRRCKITLVHQDPELSVLLHEAPESPAVLTIWRSWADFLSKPPLYGEAVSATQKPAQRAAWPRPRRKYRPFSQRRPRFLQRRRCGRFDGIVGPLRPAREITAQE